MADTQRFPGDDGWLIQITSRVKRLEELLREYRCVVVHDHRYCRQGKNFRGEPYDDRCGICKRTDAELIVEGPASEVKP